jgi:hypothetical protein
MGREAGDSFDGWLPLACMRDLGLGIVFMFLLLCLVCLLDEYFCNLVLLHTCFYGRIGIIIHLSDVLLTCDFYFCCILGERKETVFGTLTPCDLYSK